MTPAQARGAVGIMPSTTPLSSVLLWPSSDPRSGPAGHQAGGAEASRRGSACPGGRCKYVIRRDRMFWPRGSPGGLGVPVCSSPGQWQGLRLAGRPLRGSQGRQLCWGHRPSCPWSTAPLRGPHLLPAGKCPVTREGRGGEKQVLFTCQDLTTPLATTPPLTLPNTVTTTPMAASSAHFATHSH